MSSEKGHNLTKKVHSRGNIGRREISVKRVKYKHLECLIGRLNHVSGIYNPMRHFLSRLYQAQFRASKSGWTSFTVHEQMDLHLLLSFLCSAYEVISMNVLTFRKPTHVFHSDASECGLGGYNLVSRQAWRFEIPVDCRLRERL
jgi:hypothetical protein